MKKGGRDNNEVVNSRNEIVRILDTITVMFTKDQAYDTYIMNVDRSAFFCLTILLLIIKSVERVEHKSTLLL